jgi:hypothetical protein
MILLNYMASPAAATEAPAAPQAQEVRRSELPLNNPGYLKIRNSTILGEKDSVPSWKVQINHDPTHLLTVDLRQPGVPSTEPGNLSNSEVIELSKDGTKVNTSGEVLLGVPIRDAFVARVMKDYNPTGDDALNEIVLEQIAKAVSETIKRGQDELVEDAPEHEILLAISRYKREKMANVVQQVDDVPVKTLSRVAQIRKFLNI